MITITKNGNAVQFTFSGNSTYLQDGTIEVPVNSLSLVVDDSNFFTFKKAASSDIFVSASYDELGMSKNELITFYKNNMIGSTGGGGGTDTGTVQTMIDESISGKADTSAVTVSINEAVSGYADSVLYNSQSQYIEFYHNGTGGTKVYELDASDFVIDGMIDDVRIDTISGVTYLVIDFNTASGKEDIQIPLTDIFDPSNYYTKNEIDAALSGKADTTAVTESINEAVSGKLDTSTFETYSGNVETVLGNKADTTAVTEAISAATNDMATQTWVGEQGYITGVDLSNYATTGDVESAVNVKLDTSVYETYTGTTVPGLLANKQDVLSAGTGIEISGNVISATGGGGTDTGTVQTMIDESISGKADTSAVTTYYVSKADNTVDETPIYEIYGSQYSNSDGSVVTKAIFDYTGDKTQASEEVCNINLMNLTTHEYTYITLYLNYTNGTYTKSGDDDDLLTVEYDSTIEDFKVSISLQNYQINSIQFWGANIKVQTLTISSGQSANVIETSITNALSDLYNKDIDNVKGINIDTTKKSFNISSITKKGQINSNPINLGDLKIDNGTMSTDINIPLGTSAWTEVNFAQNPCAIDIESLPRFWSFRMSGDTTDMLNWGFNINAELGYTTSYGGVSWDENENTFVISTGVQELNPTLTWDSSNAILTIEYPQTVTVEGTVYDVRFSEISNFNCQFGQAITKFEYYGELTQPLVPCVEDTRAALSGKQDTLSAGTGIVISGNVISATGGGGGVNVVQTPGTSTTDVMSQDAVTTEISKCVSVTANQTIKGKKIFTYSSNSDKAIEFRQIDNSSKVGFAVKNSAATNNELASFEFRPNTFTIDGVQHPLLYFGHYRNTNVANAGVPQTVIGFRQYDQLNTAAYHYLLPLPEKAKTPFSLTTTFKDYYAPMGFKVNTGGTIVETDETGLVDLSSYIGGGGSITIDPSLDSGSTNAVANSAITAAIDAKLDASAITTTITSSSTDSQVPSAKAVYDTIGDIETLLSQI